MALISKKSIKRIAAHTALSYSAVVFGLIGAFIIEMTIPPLKNSSFLAPTLCFTGFALGLLMNKLMRELYGVLTWLVPFLILLFNFFLWQVEGMNRYDSFWQTYFGEDCGSTECLYQLSTTLPLYTALAYSERL